LRHQHGCGGDQGENSGSIHAQIISWCQIHTAYCQSTNNVTAK
jgi:hypothetical protein